MTDLATRSLPLHRFIPFSLQDLRRVCVEEGGLDSQSEALLRRATDVIEAHFRHDFHALRCALKQSYAPIDPDRDTRRLDTIGPGVDDLAELLNTVLNRANYEKVTEEMLQKAFNNASLFKVQLDVDMNDFEEVLLFTRGAERRTEQVPRLLGLFPRSVEFTNFYRVVLYLKFSKDADTRSALGGYQPGTTMLKLFQNVPAADVEMLFPNTRVGMRLVDKLLIGVPALVSGGIVLSTKMGATLVLLGSLLGFWMGLSSEAVTLDRGGVLVLLAGLAALGGYLWKQFSGFRNRKLQFTQALTENLYFKLLDNNAGVIFRILDEAEESECKESFLAYYFLLTATQPLSQRALDERIEDWFAERLNCRLDFEVDDALAKLEGLGLARQEEQRWRALTPGNVAGRPFG